MFVTLDWINAHDSLNRAQAQIDGDGVLRVIVSKSDPGSPNWMDTWVTQGRAAMPQPGLGAGPAFTTRLVPAASVFDHLPDGTRRFTLAERQEALEQRRTGAQLRRLW